MLPISQRAVHSAPRGPGPALQPLVRPCSGTRRRRRGRGDWFVPCGGRDFPGRRPADRRPWPTATPQPRRQSSRGLSRLRRISSIRAVRHGRRPRYVQPVGAGGHPRGVAARGVVLLNVQRRRDDGATLGADLQLLIDQQHRPRQLQSGQLSIGHAHQFRPGQRRALSPVGLGARDRTQLRPLPPERLRRRGQQDQRILHRLRPTPRPADGLGPGRRRPQVVHRPLQQLGVRPAGRRRGDRCEARAVWRRRRLPGRRHARLRRRRPPREPRRGNGRAVGVGRHRANGRRRRVLLHR